MTIRPSFVVYLNNVFGLHNSGLCAEIGVSSGRNASAMLNQSDISLILVDDYVTNVEFADAEERAKKTLESFGHRIFFIKKPSIDAVKEVRDESLDYVYIDGGHDYADVKSDIEAWYPKLIDKGMLAGHDFWKKSVTEAVIEFANKEKVIVYGVSVFGNIGSGVVSNAAMMCDWWLFKGVSNGIN